MKTSKVNESIITAKQDFYDAVEIETTVEQLLTQGVPIDGTGQLLYSERKDGVLPETDPRTDRFDIACKAMDKVTASIIAKREQEMKKPKEEEEAA